MNWILARKKEKGSASESGGDSAKKAGGAGKGKKGKKGKKGNFFLSFHFSDIKDGLINVNVYTHASNEWELIFFLFSNLLSIFFFFYYNNLNK